MESLTRLVTASRLVVKVGSALVTSNGNGLDLAAIDDWARQIGDLRRQGKEVVLVSSGAIACGMQRLGWSKRPKAVHELQAAAAVGQMGLVQVYEAAFARYGLRTAQILLTHDDLADRKRYLNARSALTTLLELGVVPIIGGVVGRLLGFDALGARFRDDAPGLVLGGLDRLVRDDAPRHEANGQASGDRGQDDHDGDDVVHRSLPSGPDIRRYMHR